MTVKSNMKRSLITISIFLIALIPSAVGAQTISLGEGGDVEYTEKFEFENVELFYNGDELVLSAHDENGDGVFETWLWYRDDIVVREGHDTDTVAGPDAFFELNTNEDVTREFGEGISTYTKPDIVSFETRIEEGGISETEDLVGDLSSITIPGGSNPFLIVLFVIIAILGFVWWKRQRNRIEQTTD